MWAVEDVARASKAVTCQVGCRKPGACGVRSVQLLRICCIAQEFPEPRRLGAGRAEGVSHLFGSQLQQMADRRGRRKRACSARCMKDAVVRAPKEFSDADADFITRNAGRQQVSPACPERLRDRKRCGENDSRRVENSSVVYVILLGGVGRSGVHDRGYERAGAAPMYEDFARPVHRPHRFCEACD